MESDLCAVDGLKSSVLVKLQELSLGGEKKAPVERFEFRSSSIGRFRRKRNWTQRLRTLRDSLQKCIDEGAVIILE